MSFIVGLQNEWDLALTNTNNIWLYLGLFLCSILIMYLVFICGKKFKIKNIFLKSIFVLCPVIIFGAFIKMIWIMPITFGIIFLLLLFISVVIYTPKGLLKMYTEEKIPKPFWVKKSKES